MQYERDRATVDSDLRAARARQELYDGAVARHAARQPGHRRNRPGRPARRRPAGGGATGTRRRACEVQRESSGRAATAARNRDSCPPKRPAESTSAPTNPAYIQLQSQANAAAIEVRELSARRSRDLGHKLSSAQGAVTLSPRARRAVHRPRARLRGHQDPVRADARAAGNGGTASKVAGSAAAETYVLINPARVPEDPVEPDRLALMFLGIVLSDCRGTGNGFPPERGGFHHSRHVGRRRTGRRGTFRACSGDPQPDRAAPPTHHGPRAGDRHGHDRPGPADLRRLSAGLPGRGMFTATQTHAIEVGYPAPCAIVGMTSATPATTSSTFRRMRANPSGMRFTSSAMSR